MIAALYALVSAASLLLLAIGVRLRQQWFIDTPNQRSLHATAIPRIGGLLLVPVLLIGGVLLNSLHSLPEGVRYGGWAVLGLWLLAAIDDARGLGALPRFVVQLAICIVSCCLFWQLLPSYWWLLWLLYALASLNFYNFMDGSDGIAGLQGVVGFAACAAFAQLLWPDSGLSLLALLPAAVLVVFLWFNWHPAKLFLGDAGSTVIGFGAALFAALFYMQEPKYSLLAVLPFLPFWLDAGITLAKRILRGEKFWQAHRQHLYQQLILAGASHQRIAVCYAVASVVCSVFGGLIYLLLIGR